MSFISPDFIVFFLVVLIAYFWLPQRFRWILLLVAGYFFYGYWNYYYLLIIAFTTLVDFFAARRIGSLDPTTQKTQRSMWLAASLSSNLGVLFFFKYFNFFNHSLATVFAGYEPLLINVLLPVGISFYTFQSMAYTIDVYRGKIPAEKHLGIFATFVAFFPQLVAGPIERGANILPQFRETHCPDYTRMVEGMRLILWGAFKKVVIADRLALYVNNVYNNVSDYSGSVLIVATLFFAIQIYCDFSGYTDIAIGTARILGFRLMDNFRQPYLSRSIREFWRRWHISLSTWFRDYLYIPLGGNRVSFARNLLNLMIVFVVSGLWHGANWTFVIWGALHGFYIVAELVLIRIGGQRLKIPGIVSAAITFVLVCFAWIFFRANNIGDAAYIVSSLFNFSSGLTGIEAPFTGSILDARMEFLLAWGLIAFLLVIDWLDSRYSVIVTPRQIPLVLRWAAYYALSFGIIFSLFNNVGSNFIYFQF
jgi:D-alanyl-lipoteichoic acid acyltransferase DltB (MBOAT superfamily)